MLKCHDFCELPCWSFFYKIIIVVCPLKLGVDIFCTPTKRVLEDTPLLKRNFFKVQSGCLKDLYYVPIGLDSRS